MHIAAVRMEARRGHVATAGQAVTDIRDTLIKSTDEPAYAWSAVLGENFGTFYLSLRADGIAHYLTKLQKLTDDTHYQKLSSEAGDHFDQVVDPRLYRIVGATGIGDPKAFTSMTAAMMRAPSASAMQWCQAALELVSEISGVPGMLMVADAGFVNEVAWVFGVDSADDVDAMSAAVRENPDYLKHISGSADHFVDGSVRRALLAMMP
jgi:hypothetical protein